MRYVAVLLVVTPVGVAAGSEASPEPVSVRWTEVVAGDAPTRGRFRLMGGRAHAAGDKCLQLRRSYRARGRRVSIRDTTCWRTSRGDSLAWSATVSCAPPVEVAIMGLAPKGTRAIEVSARGDRRILRTLYAAPPAIRFRRPVFLLLIAGEFRARDLIARGEEREIIAREPLPAGTTVC